MSAAAFAVAIAVAVAVGACGGSAAPASSPGSETAAPSSVDNGAGGTMDNPQTHGPATNSTQSPQPPTPPEVAGARGDLDRAERQLSSSLGDCTTACRALASMERAADHLCALDAGAECARARQRVESARERVRSSCGACSR